MKEISSLITIVGIGPATPDMLTLKAAETLLGAECIVFRTKKHPVALWLKDNDKEYIALDYIYEQCDTFEELERSISNRVISLAGEFKSIVYAVPGHGISGDGTVKLLLQSDCDIKIIPGIPGGFDALGIAGVSAWQFGDGSFISTPAALLCEENLFSSMPIMITQLNDSYQASQIKLPIPRTAA